MKRVLIIGGSGFLGKHLIEALTQNGVELFALVNKRPVPGIDPDKSIRGGLKAVSPALMDRIRPEVIFHVARPVMPRLRKLGRALAAIKARRLNERLLKALNKSETKPVLAFASGSLMYGSSPDPHVEDAPLNPVSYARQYYRGEIPVVNAAKEGSYPALVFRLPWLLGEGSWFGWFYLSNIRNRKAIPQFGNGQNMMEIIDIRDAAKLMVKIAFEKGPTGIINIPSAGAVSQDEFLQRVSDVFQAKIVDYTQLYPGKVEKETLEAFTSNILVGTKYPELFRDFGYKGLGESLGNFFKYALQREALKK